MSEWTITQGAAGTWTITAMDGSGTPVPYVGTETLAGSVWPGGSRASLITLAPTWLDPPAGTSSVAIDGAASIALAAMTYRVLCTVDSVPYYRGTLRVLSSPGAATGPATYTDDDDLRTYAAWIDDLQADTDQAGFALQCGQAREWLDEILISRWKFVGSPQIGDYGYGAWTMFGGRDPVASKYIRDQLAANTLMIRGVTKEIVAKRALYLICAAQLGKNGDHSYQDLARSFRFQSEEMVKTYRAELDLNSDGFADLFINCGATSLR